MIDFQGFPKIARLSRECVITEKLDGTNAQIFIRPAPPVDPYAQFEFGVDIQVHVLGVTHYLRAGNKTQWISWEKSKDNHGFAAWVHAHAHELARDAGRRGVPGQDQAGRPETERNQTALPLDG